MRVCTSIMKKGTLLKCVGTSIRRRKLTVNRVGTSIKTLKRHITNE